ncbi:hypothetical protein HUJ04_011581 [Dendroctonus ponderosae]|uniref:Cilia- and flagella-associated protein 126 n=1 Tax=Dendroctonus ponderosae TaxID=77166 RepID=A0AAR5QDB0_DENPD|nr:hypothetical protein HUJ04_011578 [Dendroctonus ponderosae]KAH1022144.1 hypothetical protein HUJ04_011581 [Dendroctonus ponderosae]
MAKHFYSYQFDMPYRATYLRNWEVPKYYCPKPRRRIRGTTIISNSRRQLLPGVPRPPCNPFGDFTGTWQMPKQITRKVANKLNGLTDKAAFMKNCRRIAAAPLRRPERYSKKAPAELVAENKPDEKKTDELETPKKAICPIHDF